MAQHKTVATPTEEYSRAAKKWSLPRALMGGTAEMRNKGRTYLPQEPGETDQAYDSRLSRTTLFNAYRKTVKDMTGKVFSKPVDIGDDMPESLKQYAENIDLAGRDLSVFARDVFEDGMQAGISFILAETPPLNGQRSPTRAEDRASGRRPYLVHIRAEDLIGWKSELRKGEETLTQIRIAEEVSEPDPEHPFEDVLVSQIRVLEPGSWQVYRSNREGTWFLHDEGTTTLDVITLAPVYINRVSFMVGEPPLEDLADLNVSQWQSQSDQRNILHVARVPILFGAGFDENTKLTIGANTMARATDPNAKLSYVEHSGSAIGAGENDLKRLEMQMQAMGLQLLIPEPGGQTATGEIRDDTKENAPLAMMARALQDALEQAFGFMAQYDGLGEDAGGSLTVNTDFGVVPSGVAEQNTLLASATNGLITHETYLRELQRRGILADDFEPDEEVKKLSLFEDDLDAEPLRSGTDDPGAGAQGPEGIAA